MSDRAAELLDGIRSRNPRAIGRAMTLLLGGGGVASELRAALGARIGGGRRIGVTGAPGAGKSTLVAAAARQLVGAGEEVGVVACDPRSPRSGGAFLGDRVRLAGFRLADDRRVFFRSLAGNDHAAAEIVADVLDAAGYPRIFIETVGAGQADVAVRDRVHTVVLVLAPGAGDDIQLLKAGILEIADVYVVTRRDRPGAAKLHGLLEERIGFAGRTPAGWTPVVAMVEALRGEGIDELVSALDRHAEWSRSREDVSHGA
jgi:LAO/AO transport system kinase